MDFQPTDFMKSRDVIFTDLHELLEHEWLTQAKKTITSDHAAIHAGIGYVHTQRAAGVANGGTMLTEFKTPASRYVHMKRIEEWGEGGLNTFEILEAPTLTTGVTALTPINRNRNSTRASAVVIKSDPTTISGGTSLEAFYYGGGGVGGGAGGNRSMDLEYVLKPDTTYLFRLTNNSGSAKALGLCLFWYEEEQGV